MYYSSCAGAGVYGGPKDAWFSSSPVQHDFGSCMQGADESWGHHPPPLPPPPLAPQFLDPNSAQQQTHHHLPQPHHHGAASHHHVHHSPHNPLLVGPVTPPPPLQSPPVLSAPMSPPWDDSPVGGGHHHHHNHHHNHHHTHLGLANHNAAANQQLTAAAANPRIPTPRSPYEWMKKHPYQTTPNPGKTRTKDKYRVVYTDHQRLELEKEFHYSRYITIRRKTELAVNLGLSERQVKIWFQNRRAKERKQVKKRDEQSLHKEKMQQLSLV